MDAINLDFLETTSNQYHAERAGSPFIYNKLDVKFGKKISKRLELAQTVAKVDELVEEIDKLKRQNNELKHQLKDFQVTAQQVQDLYTKENKEHSVAKYNLEKLQKEYCKIDEDFTKMHMLNEQLKSRLAQYEGRPINFDTLVVKYVKIMNKLDGDNILRYCSDKDLIEKLREYCSEMKLKLPRANSPKKSRSRKNKVNTEDAFVQCALLEDSALNGTNCLSYNTKPTVKDQHTQCSPKKCDQASQYIGTMITRQTSTEKIVQKHVQTMFPEPPAIEDILSTYSRWSNIRSVSPLLESPTRQQECIPTKEIKKFSAAGTCTMLCNIRRKIDYITTNNSSNIKQEFFTPSASPMPTTYPIRIDRSGVNPTRMSSIPNQSSLLNLYNSTTNSSLGQLPSNAFNELWQIFGKMLLSLLKNDSNDATNANKTSPLNQQQFLDWLLELYANSQIQNTSTDMDTRDSNISPNPLYFNESSTLPTNVMRPQPQKSVPGENVTQPDIKENGTKTITTSNLFDYDHLNNRIVISDSSNTPLTCSSNECNCMNDEIEQITSFSNELETSNSCKFNPHNLKQTNIPKNRLKSPKKSKSKHTILEQIQELLPETTLNKKKCKALKRLLKNSNHRKKSFETRNDKNFNKQSSVVILTNDINNDDTIETAVDFLKTFAVSKQNDQPFDDNYSETEKIFMKQILNENNIPNRLTSEEFIQPTSHTSKDILKLNHNIEKKYQFLFGESDNDFEDHNIETSNFNTTPVINDEFTSTTNHKFENLDNNHDCSIVEEPRTTECSQLNVSIANNFNEICQQNFTPLEQASLQDVNYSQEISIPDMSTAILKDIEFTYLPNILQVKSIENSENLHTNANTQIITLSAKTNSIANNSELLSTNNCGGKKYEESSKSECSELNTKPVIINDIKYGNYINNFIEKDNSKPENFNIHGFYNNNMPPLQNFETNNSTDDMKNFNENDSYNKTTSASMYSDDIENDLELSSDNESLISESNVNVKQNSSSSSIEMSSNDNFKEEKRNSLLNLESYQQKNIEIHNLEEDFRTGELTYLESNSQSEVALENKEKDVSSEMSVSSFAIEANEYIEKSSKPLSTKIPSTQPTQNGKSNTENTLVWSVITVDSDTFESDELYDQNLVIQNLPHADIRKNNNDNVSKVCGSSTLKLSNFNKTYDFQQQYVSTITNAGANKDVLKILDGSNEAQMLFNGKNNIFLTYDQDATKADGNANDIFECQNISEVSPVEQVTLYSTSDSKIIDSSCTQRLHTPKVNNSIIKVVEQNTNNDNKVKDVTTFEFCKENDNVLKSLNCDNGINVSTQSYLNGRDNNCLQEVKGTLQNNINSCRSVNIESEIDLNDSLSPENELIIDEEPNENTSEQSKSVQLNSSSLTESEDNFNDSINSSNITTLLNSSLYNEVLTESLNPIVNDLLNEEVITASITPENKPKRGRKRKSECQNELLPCKRSQRLKAKQIMLEGDSFNITTTPVELYPYTSRSKNIINNVKLKPLISEEPKNLKSKFETENPPQLGFFKERETEVDVTLKIHKTYALTRTEEPVEGINNDSNKEDNSNKEEEKVQKVEQVQLSLKSKEENKEEEKPNNKNFIYTDSPQSPTPPTTNNDTISETFVIIPSERPTQFIPRENLTTLFDVLIDSYKNENQKQVLKSVTTKECKHNTTILNQIGEQLNLYCYNEMELDLYCTSTRTINKILSITPDYNLIQKSLITLAENAAGTNISEKDLPSFIQEMPPTHLSKCLQRIFVFLKNIITRNSNFCQALILTIESILFNSKQKENLSLQSTLNLTQLYLMATKVQESLHLSKNPTRLFIAKCLYFYIDKSSIMIHEVLMWYPTVLPYREDKTYDRSDALISVIQHILMNTKYDMDKSCLRGKALLSKLRYEYHFEPYKPSKEEVISILVEKLKNSKFYNISLAFGLLCKRIGMLQVQHEVLNQHLLPLANEYYSLALKTNEYDKRIAVLLEVISMLVKPLPIETDIQKYFNEFSRFLNGFERQIIQEAALCSVLRLQRFNVKNCYKLLCRFQPAYNLNTHTEAMLKTFLYRHPLEFWKNLKSNDSKNLN